MSSNKTLGYKHHKNFTLFALKVYSDSKTPKKQRAKKAKKQSHKVKKVFMKGTN